MAAAMARGPGCPEGLVLSDLCWCHQQPAQSPPAGTAVAGAGEEPSVCAPTCAPGPLPGAAAELTGSLLSPQGRLLQCRLRAQSRAHREHQVLAGIIYRLVFPGECQRGWEPLGAVHRQP